MATPVLVDTQGFTSVREPERRSLQDDEKSIDSSTQSPKSAHKAAAGSSSDEPDVQYGTQEDNPHGLYIKDHLGQPTPAESEILAQFYEPPDEYENKHRWDPRATWTPAEQKALLRKLDLRVALVACICFAALQLDRGNISNALSDNMLKDLHLTTADYNVGQTIFYCCFLFAELPSQMSKWACGRHCRRS